MDILGELPPEIALLIFESLPSNDLWSCTSVSKKWRARAGIEMLWNKHLSDYEINLDQLDPDLVRVMPDPFRLSRSCRIWLEVQQTAINWRLNKFKKFILPAPLREPLFFSYGNTLASLEINMRIRTYVLKKTHLILTSQMYLPFQRYKAYIPEGGSLLLNNEYLVYQNFNVFIVYRKDLIVQRSYSFHSAFALNRLGTIDFVDIKCDRYLSQLLIDSDLCVTSYLNGDKMWISFSNGEEEFHYLVGIDTKEIQKIVPPISTVMLECKAAKGKIVLEYESTIVVYDFRGNLLFRKEFGDYLNVGCSDKLLAVIDPKEINVLDFTTGNQLCILPNLAYLPLYIYFHPVKKIIYLTSAYLGTFKISAFSVALGESELLWETPLPIDSCGKLGPKFKFIYGLYLIVFVENIHFRCNVCVFMNRVIFIDALSGSLVHDTDICDLLLFKKDFFVSGNKPVSLYLT